jgi:hypothetical protein
MVPALLPTPPPFPVHVGQKSSPDDAANGRRGSSRDTALIPADATCGRPEKSALKCLSVYAEGPVGRTSPGAFHTNSNRGLAWEHKGNTRRE